MATDRNGHTAATGDVYLVAGTLRAIEGSTDLLLVMGSDGEVAIRCKPTDVCLVDAARGDELFTCYGGSAAAGVTELVLTMDGGELVDGEPAVPVATAMTSDKVAVSWLSDSTPAGAWTLTLYRRPVGGTFSSVATFSVTTS